jgi:hypothetical protein
MKFSAPEITDDDVWVAVQLAAAEGAGSDTLSLRFTGPSRLTVETPHYERKSVPHVGVNTAAGTVIGRIRLTVSTHNPTVALEDPEYGILRNSVSFYLERDREQYSAPMRDQLIALEQMRKAAQEYLRQFPQVRDLALVPSLRRGHKLQQKMAESAQLDLEQHQRNAHMLAAQLTAAEFTAMTILTEIKNAPLTGREGAADTRSA